MIRDGTGCKNAGGHSHAINPHVEWVPSPFCLNFCFSSSNSSKQPYPITTTESKGSMIKRGRISSMIVHTVSNFSLISFLSVLLSLEVQAAPKQLSRIVSKLNSMISNHDQHNIFFFIFSCHHYVLRNLFKRSFICLSWKLPSRLLPRHSLHFPFKDVRANCFRAALLRTKFTVLYSSKSLS